VEFERRREHLSGLRRYEARIRKRLETDMNRRSVYVILGATGGIGSAVTHALAREGATLALAARGADRLEALASEIDNSSFRSLDGTDLASVEGFVKDTAAEHGQVDGIVNCVGSILLKAAHLTSPDEWRTTLSANLDSAFAAVRAGVKTMREEGGSIVLMASAAARVGLPNHEAIAAAKAGVIGLGRSAAATYAAKGIRVNVVAPGLVDTPLASNITGNELMLKASAAMHPLGRIGQPEDVASVITWLLTSRSSWVTGQVIGVDGGLSTVRAKAQA
jgi:NAD(P)-dependent dehydrogenase (short-subunit alcohol dehydrogenase family)